MGPALQKGAESTLITQYCQLKLDEKQEHRILNLKPAVIKSRFSPAVKEIMISKLTTQALLCLKRLALNSISSQQEN
jgi:hypothetical protein